MFSPDERYRFSLQRLWHEQRPMLNIIGLNPSTADATRDDPTIRRCLTLARRLGCGELVVTNLFAFRATSPADMRAQADPVGPNNDMVIEAWAEVAKYVVVAWGTHGAFRDRHAEVTRMVQRIRPEVFCLGRTKDGYPRHPLYLPSATPLEVYQ